MVSAKQMNKLAAFRNIAEGRYVELYCRKTVGLNSNLNLDNSITINHLLRNICREANLGLNTCSTYISLNAEHIAELKGHGFAVEKEPDDEIGWFYVISWENIRQIQRTTPFRYF